MRYLARGTVPTLTLGNTFALGITTSSPRPPLDGAAASREEAAFYTQYDWCLNPVLALGPLFQRLGEELDRAPTLTASWQRAESRINVYLFTCAIACTVDDYLSRPLGDLTSIGAHFPRLRWAARLGDRLLQGVQALRGAATNRAVARWRRQWQRCVDAACELLVHASEPGTPGWGECDARLRALAPSGFPARLLRRRMTLPAAFRNQDLTHYDVSVLARRVIESRAAGARPVVVVGLRTAGAYLAPLLKAHLASSGVAAASWMTLRPKQAPSPWEHRQLHRLRRSGAHVVVVDEPPNSGKTFRLTLEVLGRAGVGADRVTVAVPRSPAKVDWTLRAEPAGALGPQIVTLDPPDYFKARMLDPASIAPRLREYCGPGTTISDNAETRGLNAHLRAHHTDGFHVRLKRVFQVQRDREGRPPTSTYVVAKSVGWGWLGYHAYIAGTRLAGLVPRVLGLRDGLMFTEWVGALEADETRDVPDIPVQTLASYVATRARRLRLTEDPCFEDLDYGRTGWSELINLLRRAYGLYVGRFKIPALHRRLRTLLSPAPALIDGRMRPEEWVGHGTGVVKADFEHHTFGKTELNVVDPASDLAYATLTFGLCPERERQLVDAYARDSGDREVGERLLFYQLLHGALVMSDAFAKASGDRSEARHDWNQRYLMARNWLTSRLSRFGASLIPAPAAVTWSKRLFFLDLDGVFDAEAFGFPHTTTSGLAALALLRAHDFSVVVHTGRSVADVHSYCRDYGLPGGVAELGSVFVDAVAGRETPLIDAAASEQLATCRAVLSQLDGVFVDPTYRYAVRAYRIAGERTVPPPRALVEEALRRAGLDRLAISPSSVDVVVLARGVDKGHGLTAVRDYLGCAEHPVAAIGDSDRDVPMLKAADFAFAPSGCSPGVRALASRGQCSIMAAPMQRGLLRAARELASLQPGPADRSLGAVAPPAPASALMATLLEVAERSQLGRLLSALAWWRL